MAGVGEPPSSPELERRVIDRDHIAAVFVVVASAVLVIGLLWVGIAFVIGLMSG